MQCVSCGKVTTEDFIYNSSVCPFSYTESDKGVKCTNCSHYTCGFCISGFLERGCNKFVNQDKWAYDMTYFCTWGVLPCKNFKCHACEWNHEKDNARIN